MLYGAIKEATEQLVAQYRMAIEDDKLSLSEIYELTQSIVKHLVRVVETLKVPGKTKKELVMEAAEKFYDEVLVKVHIKYIPAFLRPLINPILKKMYMSVVSSLIDYTVDVFNSKVEFTRG